MCVGREMRGTEIEAKMREGNRERRDKRREMKTRKEEQEMYVVVSDKRNKGESREQVLKNICMYAYIVRDKEKDGERDLEDVYIYMCNVRSRQKEDRARHRDRQGNT